MNLCLATRQRFFSVSFVALPQKLKQANLPSATYGLWWVVGCQQFTFEICKMLAWVALNP